MAAKKQQPIELISSEKDKAKALATTLEKIGVSVRRKQPLQVHRKQPISVQ